MKPPVLLIIVVFFANNVSIVLAQNPAEFVTYERGFKFIPGIYLNIEAWKNNDPITPDRIITSLDPSLPEFFVELLSDGEIKYYDQSGQKQKVNTENIFGYAVDNLIFTRKHQKIPIIGAICHYSNIEFYAYSNYINSNGQVPYPSGRSSTYNSQLPIVQKGQFEQYIIDFETGNRMKFNQKNLETILQRDPILLQEYKQSGMDKKDKLFVFLRKYNEKHPINFKIQH